MLPFVDGARAGAAGARLTIGIRPEHLRIGQGGLSMQVDLVEPLGGESVLHGKLPDGTPLTARLQGATYRDGPMDVILPLESLHVFDGETGKRIEAGR